MRDRMQIFVNCFIDISIATITPYHRQYHQATMYFMSN